MTPNVAMKILGDPSVAITGYEIVSPAGSLNGPGWTAGNLDAQNVGDPRQLGLMSDPASTWLTFLATDSRLIEAYLLGSSTFASDISIGAGYDAAQDARDLVFNYSTPTGENALGVVTYVNSPLAVAASEPSVASS